MKSIHNIIPLTGFWFFLFFSSGRGEEKPRREKKIKEPLLPPQERTETKVGLALL